jgi:serine/threonine protein kinase/tetratricopeptide (TPR) repeat protein
MASRVGQAFGRFRIVERIGAGGMGEVYRAHDAHLNRDVAIKFLAPGAVQGDQRRMEREAHALSTLNHANIATIHDFVHDEAGDFVVMEFIAGESLATRLKAGPLDVPVVLVLARQIAAGLDEAHSHGIVHRDLKPGNLMLTPKGQLKIVDFGIAEPARDEANAATVTTIADSRAMGTLAYMSPEQIRGAAVDPRTDIWSFGAVLYELLTGRAPFIETNTLLLADAVLNRVPASPSSVNSDVPAAFDRVILRALNKSPAERQASAGELVGELESPGRTPVIRPRSRRRLARNRVVQTIAAAAIVAAVATAAWWLLGNRPPSAPASKISVLVGDAVNRTGDASLDDILFELLSTSLEQSQAISVYPRTRVAHVLQNLMRRDPSTPIDETVGREICAREGLNALVTSSVSRLGDGYLLVVAMTDAAGRPLGSARETFQNAAELPVKMDATVLSIRQRIGESAASIQKSSVPLADVASSSLDAVRLYTRARQRQYAGDPLGAIALYRQAIALDPQFAMAYEYLGVAYTNLQDMTHAEEYFTQAVKLAERVPEAERRKILADYNMMRRNYAVACPHFEILAELRPLDPTSFLSLGYCKSFTFDYAGAIADTERGLKMQATQRARVNLAWLKFLSGDAAAALTGVNALRKEVPNNLQAHFVAAQAELALGQIDAARTTYETMVGLGGPAEMQGQTGLADIALGTGRWKEARALLTAAADSAGRQQNLLASVRIRTALAELAIAEGRAVDVAGLATSPAEQSDLVLVYLAGRTLARAGRLADAERTLAGMKLKSDAAPADLALASLLKFEIASARRDAVTAVAEADAAWSHEKSVLAREAQALAYTAAGRPDDAASAYTDVLRRRTERIAAYDAQSFHRVVQAEYRLGTLLDDKGLREGARPLLEKILSVWTGEGGGLASDARRRLAKYR